jgi:hypothetical protein
MCSQGNNVTLGRKIVRLALTHEASEETFRKEAQQMAPIPVGVLDEIHHVVKQRFKQACAADDEAAANMVEGPGGFVSAGAAKGGEVVETHRPVFIKPAKKAEPTERKSLLGLDRLAAAKRAENFLKQQMEEESGGGASNGNAGASMDDFEMDSSNTATVGMSLLWVLVDGGLRS